MFYVYYLRSQIYSEKTYIGFTSNLKQRLLDHNAGRIFLRRYFNTSDV